MKYRWLTILALAGCTANAGAAADCGSTTTVESTTEVPTSTVLSTTTTTSNPAPPTTSNPSTTTTVTSTSTSTSTSSTSTVPATSTTAAPPPPGDFFADFTDPNQFYTDFRHGLFRRDNPGVGDSSWPADHDMSCGAPTIHRTIHKNMPEEGFFVCGPPGVANSHVMVSEGNTNGYSIAWISPNRVFNMSGAASVCWKVNLTNMGTRQWFEVGVIPATASDLFVEASIASAVADHPEVVVYPKTNYAVMLWSGPSAWLGKLGINGNVNQFNHFDAGSDVATRYPVCFKDNGTGTLTTTIYHPTTGAVLLSHSRPGSFPHVPSKVIFAAKYYTPTKDGPVISTTWHWDDTAVTQ